MEFRVLGPLEVREGNRLVSLSRLKQRALLGALLLRAGEAVSVDQLIDELWGERPPATAKNSLQNAISALRKAIGRDTLRTEPSGYSLKVERKRVDLLCFERLLKKARTTASDRERAELLRQALALWRGPLLADLAFEPFVLREAPRLEEVRLGAQEELVDVRLALGEHEALIPELQTLISEHPFDERLCRQLMLALYRSGRQSHALEIYRDARRTLVEELGMEPGQELRSLEKKILQGDPSLDLPPKEIPSKLPLPATRLIGRETGLQEVVELLGASRLLTLTGPGGVGKTRLALEAASALANQFRDGVCFVSLAALRDSELVIAALAHELGVRNGRTLGEYLRQRQLLLVLDNYEQLLGGAAHLSQLLCESAELTLLVTSRAPLHLSEERVYSVPPLEDAAARELFLERARAGRSVETDGSIAKICSRLDNLPLALELAAPRLKILSPSELLERLERRLAVLTSGPVDAPDRQRTLRATIRWSYELLSAEERRLFARLAVFVGGCTLNAAEEIADAELDTLQALVDKSLVERTGERFLMLETIRAFSLELLEDVAEAETQDLRRRHALFYAALLRPEADTSRTPLLGWEIVGRPFRERVAADRDNARAALDWALSANDFELALELYSACVLHLDLAELVRFQKRVLRRVPSVAPGLAADFYLTAAFNHSMMGEVSEARPLCERSLAIYRRLGDVTGEGYALAILGHISNLEDRKDKARLHFRAALAIGEKHHHDELRSLVLHGLGELEREAGNSDRAGELLRRSIEIARGAGLLGEVGTAMHSLGDLLFAEGELEEAKGTYLEALALGRDLAFQFLVIYALAGLAATAARQGDAEHAGTLWGAAQQLEKLHQTPLITRERERYEHALAAVPGLERELARASGGTIDVDLVVEEALKDRVQSRLCRGTGLPVAERT